MHFARAAFLIPSQAHPRMCFFCAQKTGESMKLLQGDCTELIQQIPDNSIDLCVTSPPYDDLRTYNKPPNLDWHKLLRELYRVTKEGGVVVWIVADQTKNGSESGTSFKQALYAKECGFRLHDTMIWDKMSPNTNPNRYIGGFEYMFVFSKSAPKTANLICDRKNKNGGMLIHGKTRQRDGTLHPKSQIKYGARIKEWGARTNIWHLQPGGNKTGHPATFLVQLVCDHILTWSNVGDTVLDPLMGSGTTCVAAIGTGRDFIGIELDEHYFEIAKKRIEEAMSHKQ